MIDREIRLRGTYDSDSDAAYIYLSSPEAKPSGSVRTVSIDPTLIDGMVNLDLDSDDRLVGIEILDASRLLSESVLVELTPE